MPQHIHWPFDGADYRSDIFELALVSIDRVVAALATTTSVHGVHAEVALKRWQHIRPRGVVASSAVHK
jgi:hypothetical protein